MRAPGVPSLKVSPLLPPPSLSWASGSVPLSLAPCTLLGSWPTSGTAHDLEPFALLHREVTWGIL